MKNSCKITYFMIRGIQLLTHNKGARIDLTEMAYL